MKRKIIMIIELNKNRVIVSVFEKLTINFIKLFMTKNSLSKLPILIQKACTTVKALVGLDPKATFVIIDPTFDQLANLKIINVSMPLQARRITKSTFALLAANVRKQHSTKDQSIIMVRPLQFVIDNAIIDPYHQVPLEVNGNVLVAKTALTSIATTTFKQINKLIDNHNLDLLQILMIPQTLSNALVTKDKMKTGAILIHFEGSRVVVTINKNRTTASYFIINNGGLNKLFEQVQADFKCSRTEAKNLVLTYGSLEPPQLQTIIYTKQLAIKELSYTNKHLHLIIKHYLDQTLNIIYRYAIQNRITHLPFIISGQITKINNVLEYIKMMLKINVSLHTPNHYLEVDPNNINVLGALQEYAIIEKQTRLPQTDLNALNNLLDDKKSKQTFIHRVINKLGEKYDRND